MISQEMRRLRTWLTLAHVRADDARQKKRPAPLL